jgi:hypothetical protein
LQLLLLSLKRAEEEAGEEGWAAEAEAVASLAEEEVV